MEKYFKHSSYSVIKQTIYLTHEHGKDSCHLIQYFRSVCPSACPGSGSPPVRTKVARSETVAEFLHYENLVSTP